MSFKNSLFLGEFKAQFSKRNLAIAGLILIMALVGVHKGVTELKNKEYEAREFKQIESYIFKKLANYRDYSNIGFKVLFVAPVTGAIVHTPGNIMALMARVNSIAALEMDNKGKGKAALKRNATAGIRLTNILFYPGILFATFLGFIAFRDPAYGRFLIAGLSRLRIYLTVIFSRFAFLGFMVSIIYGAAVFYAFIRGIPPAMLDWPAAGHFGALLLLLLFFLVAGGVTGCIRKKATAYLAVGVVLAAFVVWHILVVDTIMDINAETISSPHNLYGQKHQLIDEFEKRFIETHGEFDPEDMAPARKSVEGYKVNELPRLVEMERRHRDGMDAAMDTYYCFAVWAPTTFYNITAEAAGGKDYDDYLAFYDYLIDLQRDFVLFWIDRVFYKRPKDPKAPLEMVNFIKGDENIFRSRSHLPRYFWRGIGINLGYILLLFIGGFICFKRTLTAEDKKTTVAGDAALTFEKGYINALSFPRDIRHRVWASLTGSVTGDGLTTIVVDANGEAPKQPFLYLPDPRELPGDMAVTQMVDAFIAVHRPTPEARAALRQSIPWEIRRRRMSELSPEQGADILMDMAEAYPAGRIVFDDISLGAPQAYRPAMSERITALKEAGHTIIYIHSDGNHVLLFDRMRVVAVRDNRYNITPVPTGRQK